MKQHKRFQLDGMIDGFLQLTVIDDGFKHLVRATPRTMLGIFFQLLKIDDKKSRTVLMPVQGRLISFTISQAEAQHLASQIAALMKWKISE